MPETMPPFALIAIAVFPLVDTVTVSFVLNPLSNITVSCMALPHTIAMLQPIQPLTIVGIVTNPGVKTFPTYFAIIVLSQILVTV
jgi:hypothetical protein